MQQTSAALQAYYIGEAGPHDTPCNRSERQREYIQLPQRGKRTRQQQKRTIRNWNAAALQKQYYANDHIDQ